ncbi:hypothetical protein ACOSQ4_032575 [Xanthoceras sorbifolium]
MMTGCEACSISEQRNNQTREMHQRVRTDQSRYLFAQGKDGKTSRIVHDSLVFEGKETGRKSLPRQHELIRILQFCQFSWKDLSWKTALAM